MKAFNAHQMKVFYEKVNPDTGKKEKRKATIGVKLQVDNAVVSYNFKRQTFSVAYPDRELKNKAGGLTGEIEKGQKWTGITHKQLLRDFSPKFVELVGSEIVKAIQEG